MNRIATLALSVSLFAGGLYGCSSDSGGGTEPGVDGGGVDTGIPTDSTAPGNDANNGVDSAAPQDAAGPVDAGRPALPAFGAVCTQNSDCTSMLCEPFEMQKIMLCTQPCGDAATPNCPAPSDGTCTPKGYCRFP